MFKDLRYGLRQLLQAPGFTCVALLTLALGIGANSAIFSVVNAVLLRPLPYDDPDRLIFMGEYSEQVKNMSVSWPNYSDWRDQNQVFERIAAFRGAAATMTGTGDPERLTGAQCTANLFATLAGKPIQGRVFSPDEDKPGANRVILISEGLWKRRFGSEPGLIDKKLTLNGNVWTVVGVMPSNFVFPSRLTEYWSPLGQDADQMQQRGAHPGIYTVSRLKAGVTVERARTEMVGLAARLAQQYPQSNTGNSVNMVTLNERVLGQIRTPALVLMGAVVLVLLIACANVANLLLARGAARLKEVSIRAALGAGRWRIVRQMLTESALLSFAGGVLGVVFAVWGVRALVAATPTSVPRIKDVQVDGTVLLFTLGVALVTGILFGLAPALFSSSPNLNETLKEGGRGSSTGRSHHYLRSGLVAAEMALSLVLLVGSVLTLRSLHRLLTTSAGYNPEKVLTVQVYLPNATYPDDTSRRNFYRKLMERVPNLPGVQTAGITFPLLGGWQNSFRVEGRPDPLPGQAPSTDYTRINEDYFKAMGVPLLKGRFFTPSDNENSVRVAIIDETFARRYWPNDDPVGKRIRFGTTDNTTPWLAIVGVVGHVKNYGVDQDSRVETYVPHVQAPATGFILVLRGGPDPTVLTSAVREAVLAVDPNLPISGVRTMEAIDAESTAPRRLATMLLGIFAAIAVTLAGVGIYGVMSYSVNQRTHEIGIRMALGAGSGDVSRLVVAEGMRLAVIGVAVGLAGAFALKRVLTTMLFGISATDPATFSIAPMGLLLLALVASYFPARRATKVDPLVALRCE